ncbi:MAG: FixH family protein, partial [Solirubrobacterales bacterium]|nr:FixH family protein [Solirubrobacterales bacterium]
MPPEFALSQDSVDDTTHVVAVRGEIDLFTAPELKAALGEAIEGGKSRIVVDLTETSFLDSTALGVLIGTIKRLRSRDGRLTIVNTDQNIAKTFEITGKHVLLGMLAFFGLIIAVNIVMMRLALSTHTGVVAENTYRKGVKYNEEIAASERMALLGWRNQMALAPTGDKLS